MVFEFSPFAAQSTKTDSHRLPMTCPDRLAFRLHRALAAKLEAQIANDNDIAIFTEQGPQPCRRFTNDARPSVAARAATSRGLSSAALPSSVSMCISKAYEAFTRISTSPKVRDLPPP